MIPSYARIRIRHLRELVSTYSIPQEVHDILYKLAIRPGNRDALIVEAYNVWLEWDEDDEYDGCGDHDRDQFEEVIARVTGRSPEWCGNEDCDEVCFDTTRVEGEYGTIYVCNKCLDRHYSQCSRCDTYATSTNTLPHGREYCDSCYEDHTTYCETCDTQYADCDGDDHAHKCECEAPNPSFEFPANGKGTVRENERLVVELPKGTIDEEGMYRIKCYLIDAIHDETRWVLDDVLAEVGPVWQQKRGNFTRRLSSALYKRGTKLAPSDVSEIGNIARQHSSDTATWNVEFTRDLNQSASFFYHSESCWWQSYAPSRCCLKSWGGLGMRTFDDGASTHRPSGRVWIQPLNENYDATHDTLNAHAYVVYNAYGENLTGYVAARIVAYLTGKTYKLIDFDTQVDDTYVNNDKGYLVASEEVCADTESIYLDHNPHDTRDARSVRLAYAERTAS